MFIEQVCDESQVELIFFLYNIVWAQENAAVKSICVLQHHFGAIQIGVWIRLLVVADSGHHVFRLDLSQQVDICARILISMLRNNSNR